MSGRNEFAGEPVLVTGGSGFIGSRLVASLLDLGAVVHSLDVRPGSLGSDVTEHVGDIAAPGVAATAVEAANPRYVFHLAGFKERRADPDAFAQAATANVTGALQLLSAVAATGGVERLVAVGTCEEYGSGPAPFVETQREEPVSAYSFSKTAMVHAVMAFHHLHGVPATVLRPTIAYGPGQPPDMFLSALVAALVRGERFPMTAGEQTRDLVYVDDVVSALQLAAVVPGAAGRIVNIASGEPVLLRDLAQRVAGMFGAQDLLGFGEVPYRPGEVMDYRADVTLARELFGWAPAVPLEEGLKRTIEAALA